MSVNGDGEPGPSREQQIRARIGEIHEELGALLRELRGEGEDEDSPEKKRAAFRLLKGGLILVLIGASLGMASAAGWAGRNVRTIAATAVTVGAAGVIAGALLAQGSPTPPTQAGVPPVKPPAVPSASASAGPTGSGTASPSVQPPSGHPSRVPTVPVLVPTRRRPAATASGATASPAGPSPTPSRPAPSPAPTGSPPPPFICPAGLILEVIGIGLYVCV